MKRIAIRGVACYIINVVNEHLIYVGFLNIFFLQNKTQSTGNSNDKNLIPAT